MPRSALLLNFNKFGDTLLQTQIISGMAKADPSTKIFVLCTPKAFEVLFNNPKIAHLEVADYIPEQSLKHFFKYLNLCKSLISKFNIDTIICDKTNSTPITALLLNLLKAKTKILTGRLRLPIYNLVASPLNRVALDLTEDSPIRIYNQRLLKSLDCPSDATVEIFPTKEDEEFAQNAISQAKKSNKKIVCLAPFSSQNATTWPKKRILEFINLVQNSYELIVIGPQNDLKNIPQTPILIAPKNIRQAFAISRKSDILITLDSAPAHFLEAVGIPVLKINSARIPTQTWGYDGNSNYYQISKEVPCGPCYSSICKVDGHPCMAEISGLEVYNKVCEILHF